MPGGKPVEPRVVSDFYQCVDCVLSVSFYFGDECWEKIWQRFEEKCDSLSMADLKARFPDEDTVQSASDETVGAFNHRGNKKGLFAAG